MEANDPMWDDLRFAALKAKSEPAAWLQQRQLYGDLASNEAFVGRFSAALQTIWSDGVEAALTKYLNG